MVTFLTEKSRKFPLLVDFFHIRASLLRCHTLRTQIRLLPFPCDDALLNRSFLSSSDTFIDNIFPAIPITRNFINKHTRNQQHLKWQLGKFASYSRDTSINFDFPHSPFLDFSYSRFSSTQSEKRGEKKRKISVKFSNNFVCVYLMCENMRESCGWKR